MTLWQSFAPVYRPDARVLILGSMPGVVSQRASQYYAHPRNAFWRIVYALWDTPIAQSYPERLAFATGHHIALWDVAYSCVREGSLDAGMREILPNDIAGLTAKLPCLRAMFCNGQAAYKLYQKHFADIEIPCYALPSTSPAHTLAYEDKRAVWQAVRDEIDK